MERLAEYEDTGLTPESVEALKLSVMGKAIAEIKEFNGLPVNRLREFAEADKDGRAVYINEAHRYFTAAARSTGKSSERALNFRR